MSAFIISKDADTRAQGAALAVGGYKREAYWRFAAAELFLLPARCRRGIRLHLIGDALEDSGTKRCGRRQECADPGYEAALTHDSTRERSPLPKGSDSNKKPCQGDPGRVLEILGVKNA
jgi:hypothetical protein